MRRVVSALAVVLLAVSTGCHSMVMEARAVAAPKEQVGQVLAAVAAVCSRGHLEPAEPEAGGWWSPRVVGVFARPCCGLGLFQLVVWVERDDDGLVVFLTQYHPGWGATPELEALRSDLAASLAALAWPVTVLVGEAAWGRVHSSGSSSVQRPPRDDPQRGGRGDAGRRP